jgi:hypothetical protein
VELLGLIVNRGDVIAPEPKMRSLVTLIMTHCRWGNVIIRLETPIIARLEKKFILYLIPTSYLEVIRSHKN